jgi:streptomycin 3"-adenylyltransferase
MSKEVEQYLGEVTSRLAEHLGDGLVGVYLHGSLAMGAFHPGRSDVDVLAVCAAPITSEASVALGEALAGIPRPPSGGHLEFSLVAEAAVRAPGAAPPFQVQVSTHEEPAVVDGHDRPGDGNLVVQFAVIRARGRALAGPEPAGVFVEPDRALLLQSLLDDLDWARRSGAAGWEGHDRPAAASMAYQVLNGARGLRYVESGELGSKSEGAVWLEARDPDPDVHALLAAALAYQRGEAFELPDELAVAAFAERVDAALRAALAAAVVRP